MQISGFPLITYPILWSSSLAVGIIGIGIIVGIIYVFAVGHGNKITSTPNIENLNSVTLL